MMSDKIISETNIFYWFAAKKGLFLTLFYLNFHYFRFMK